MDAEKRKRYENIAAEIVRLVGGRDNILGVAHCATRLRLVLEDNDKADTKAIEDVDLVKGVFVAGDQLQIISGQVWSTMCARCWQTLYIWIV